MAEPDRLQPRDPLAAARGADADRHLVADESAATADENGWPAREACAVLLAAAGGRTLDAATVRGDRAAACGAIGASGIAAPSVLPTVRPVSEVGVVSEKSAANAVIPSVQVQGGHKRPSGGRRGGPPDGKSRVGTLEGGVQASKWKSPFLSSPHRRTTLTYGSRAAWPRRHGSIPYSNACRDSEERISG